MVTLGIETSGIAGSVALVRDGHAVAERTLAKAGRRHAQTLLAEIHELLQAAALAPSHIDAVAVSLGPGSFTGLRVGVVCAKTWAYATCRPVIGVPTFDTFAARALDDWRQIWAIGDAQRGDFFAAEYRCDEEQEWCCTTPVAIVSGHEWLAARSPSERVVGPGVCRVADEATPAQIVREPWAVEPSATIVAQLGAQRLQRGATDDVWTLAPIYIRPSAAEEKRPV